MRLSFTLSTYIGKQFLISLGTVLAIMGTVILLVDLVELLRRASGRDMASFGMILELTLLKLPSMLQKIFPFAALVSSILMLSRLTRTQELAVTRSAGVSVWQFLLPPIAVAAMLGVFTMTVLHPLSATMLSKYEQLEAKYLRGRASLLAVSPSGLWLRQIDQVEKEDGLTEEQETIVHALRASSQTMELYDVIIFMFDGDHAFTQRIDAQTARLETGHWALNNVLITSPRDPASREAHMEIPTHLTTQQIQESFSSPETLSFWALPAFIDTLEQAGFSALRHRLHWHSMLSLPLMLAAMVIVGAIFALRPTRSGGTGTLVAAGVLTGFILYFLSDVVHALGLSGTVPVWLAAWAPALASALLGTAALLHAEDG